MDPRSDSRSGVLAVNQQEYFTLRMVVLDLTSTGGLAMACLLAGLRYNRSVEVVVVNFDSWVPLVLGDCFLFLRENCHLKEVYLRGCPLGAPFLKALYYTLAAAGLGALERLEYSVRAGEPAAVTLSQRIVDLAQQRGRTGEGAELLVDAIVLQSVES